MKLTKKQQFLLVKLAILVHILMISGLGFFSKNQKKTSNKSNTNQTQVESNIDFSSYKKSKKYILEDGRALMYVYLDGKLLQQTLVEESLARVGYAHPPNTTLLKDLQKVEEQTKKKKKNIWEKDGYVTNRGFDTSVY